LLLRKTATSSRTAAVVRALEQGCIAEAVVTRA
jgi:DNA-binding CsgD family transcriptional regulator